MTDIQVSCGKSPQDLANVIAATLHGLVPAEPDEAAINAGRMVREAQEESEWVRPSRNDLPTVNFETIDPDDDWSQV